MTDHGYKLRLKKFDKATATRGLKQRQPTAGFDYEMIDRNRRTIGGSKRNEKANV